MASAPSSSSSSEALRKLPVLKVPCTASGTLVRWFVKLDEFVSAGQRLCEFRPALSDRPGSITTLVAPHESKVIALHAQPDQLLPRGRVLW
jgi:hypothetical protein